MNARHLLPVALVALALPCSAQTTVNPDQFNRWIAEGERAQVPWKVEVADPKLRLDQRLGVQFSVILDESQLNKHGSQHELILVARVGHETGEWLPSTSSLGKRLDGPLGPRTQLVFSMELLVLPGRYRLGVVLFDQITGHRSVTVKQLRVNPLNPEPLPQAFRNLPAAEFVRTAEGPAAFGPGATRPLWLPLQTRRRVQIELLVNFGYSEEFALPRVQVVYPGWPRARSTGGTSRQRRTPRVEENLDVVLEALKPLSALSVANGSLQFTGLDLVGRRVLWEQDLAAGMDWRRLHGALSEFNSSVVSAQTLAGQKEGPAFFREVIEQRLAKTDSNDAPAGPAGVGASEPANKQAGETPLRVFIVLSSNTLFQRGAQITPVSVPDRCECRVYFLRLNLLGNLWDELHEILEPFKPRRFDIEKPSDYRRALGAILEELRGL